MSDPNNSITVVQQAVDNYGALLHGLIVSPDPQTAGESKLRYGVKFRWTNTLGGHKTLYVKTCFKKIMQMITNLLYCRIQMQIITNLLYCRIQMQIITNLLYCRVQMQIITNLLYCRIQMQMITNFVWQHSVIYRCETDLVTVAFCYFLSKISLNYFYHHQLVLPTLIIWCMFLISVII